MPGCGVPTQPRMPRIDLAAEITLLTPRASSSPTSARRCPSVTTSGPGRRRPASRRCPSVGRQPELLEHGARGDRRRTSGLPRRECQTSGNGPGRGRLHEVEVRSIRFAMASTPNRSAGSVLAPHARSGGRDASVDERPRECAGSRLAEGGRIFQEVCRNARRRTESRRLPTGIPRTSPPVRATVRSPGSTPAPRPCPA